MGSKDSGRRGGGVGFGYTWLSCGYRKIKVRQAGVYQRLKSLRHGPGQKENVGLAYTGGGGWPAAQGKTIQIRRLGAANLLVQNVLVKGAGIYFLRSLALPRKNR